MRAAVGDWTARVCMTWREGDEKKVVKEAERSTGRRFSV